MNKKHLFLGQTMLEVVLATLLISMGLIAALALTTRSQKSVNFSRNVNLANNYSYQAIDWIRNFRTTYGWDTLLYYLQADASGDEVIYCLIALPKTLEEFEELTYGECADTESLVANTTFQREITFNLNAVANKTITGNVNTTWIENILHQVTLTFELSSWE